MPRLSKCSFCGKNKKEVEKLLKGPTKGVYICNECIVSGNHYLQKRPDQEDVSDKKEFKLKILSPDDLKKKLDQYVIGQEQAKRELCVAVYNHYKRIKSPVINGIEIDKSNIMLIGPSGSGKTLLVSNIAKILDVPYVIIDATSLTEVGFMGSYVDSIFEKLYASSGNDIERSQQGIVFIDEIDKKCIKGNGEGSSGGRDVSGEGVQHSLLRMLEGDKVLVNQDSRPISMNDDPEKYMDTKNVLFIVSGSFIGLENIIKKRINTGSTIGIGAKMMNDNEEDKNILEKVEPEDLHKFGFIREFVGRFPVQIPFHNLDEDMLMRILKEPKNNILDQYRGLFSVDGVELDFSDVFLKTVAKQCIEKKTGARGLRTILEKVLSPIQFELNNHFKDGVKRILIDDNGKPVLYKNKKRKDEKSKN